MGIVIQNYRDRGLFIEALMLAKIKNDKEEYIKSLGKAVEILTNGRMVQAEKFKAACDKAKIV